MFSIVLFSMFEAPGLGNKIAQNRELQGQPEGHYPHNSPYLTVPIPLSKRWKRFDLFSQSGPKASHIRQVH